MGEEYSGKIIHIVPSQDFKEKKYVAASDEILMALYKYYEDNAKDKIVEIVKNFARTAGSSLAGKFFEMMAYNILREN